VTNDEYESEQLISLGCGDCETLTEALRDAEQQCREAEDEPARVAMGQPLSQVTEPSKEPVDEEREYLMKIGKLEHRRNCALEVLLKHQRLEHS
jgi:hypothetical protein